MDYCLSILLYDTGGDVLVATGGDDCKLETRNKICLYLPIQFLSDLLSVDDSLDLEDIQVLHGTLYPSPLVTCGSGLLGVTDFARSIFSKNTGKRKEPS